VKVKDYSQTPAFFFTFILLLNAPLLLYHLHLLLAPKSGRHNAKSNRYSPPHPQRTRGGGTDQLVVIKSHYVIGVEGLAKFFSWNTVLIAGGYGQPANPTTLN
jgi:hypothetical protein